MNTKTVVVRSKLDQLGEPEQFTWDLFPIVPSRQTTHLQSDGLPKVGTHINPGMIVVGKIGKTKEFDPSRQPTSLEIHGCDLEELMRRYGGMWYDSSYYADPDTYGVVTSTFLKRDGYSEFALVELDPSPLNGPSTSANARTTADQ